MTLADLVRPLELADAAQRAAADPTKHVGVTANAGSGKTKVLVDRVIRLLLAGAAPDRILCVTYTKAAAGEMQSRLFQRLGAWSTAEDGDLAAELAKLEPEAGRGGARLAEARRLFARALETPGGLKIQTVHAFCERLLRRFPVEAGVAPGFEVIDDAVAARLMARARARLARAAFAGDDALLAAHERLAAALADEAFDQFLDWIARERPRLSSWFAQAADDLATPVYARLGLAQGADEAGIKAAAWTAAPRADLEEAARLFASGTANDQKQAGRLQAAFSAADPAAAFDAYAAVVFTEAGRGKVQAKPVTKSLVEKAPLLARLFGGEHIGYGTEVARMTAARDEARRARVAEISLAGLTIARAFVTAYDAEKRRLAALDFADLIARARALLSTSEAAQWTLYKLDGGLDHVLVDEAQDTAPEQWDVLDAITAEFFAGVGAAEVRRTVFLVGDEKQSIYSFQGARPERFLAARQRIIARAAGDYIGPTLDVSFRSAPAILQAVDAVMAKAPPFDGPPPEGDLPTHVAVRGPDQPGDVTGCVELWPLTPRPEPQPDADAWDAPAETSPQPDARRRLAEVIAETVRAWLDEGMAVSERDGAVRRVRPLRAGDVMILLRRRGTLFDLINRQLKARGVPVAGADRISLAAELAVEDVLGAARAALLPQDDLAVAEFLTCPFLQPIGADAPIDDEALFALAHPRTGKLWSALQGAEDPRFAEAKTVLARLHEEVDARPPHDVLARFLAAPSATGETYAARLFARLGREAEDPVRALLGRALVHERAGAASMERFVHDVTTRGEQLKREMAEVDDAARVMTAHGAKGLEAPVVILPDAADAAGGRGFEAPFDDPDCGFLWSPRKTDDPDALQARRAARAAARAAEDQRLLYVAMTRAEDRLIVCGAGGKGAGGPATWHGLVRAGLEAAGAARFEGPVAGEALRLGAPPGFATARDDAAAHAVPPDWARRPVSAEPSAPAPDSPIAPSGSPLTPDGPDPFRRGALAHKLLETLPELPPERRRPAARRYLDTQGVADATAAHALIDEVCAVLEDPGFAALFTPDARAEVGLAAPKGAAGEDGLFIGRIDRLLVNEREILAVDYKTDRAPPRDASAAPDAYVAQMARYRAALQAMYPGRTVRCALVWTRGPAITPLPPEAMDAAWARLTEPNPAHT